LNSDLNSVDNNSIKVDQDTGNVWIETKNGKTSVKINNDNWTVEIKSNTTEW
jgi:hypothetical protein